MTTTKTIELTFPRLPGESNAAFAARWAAWEKEQRAARYAGEVQTIESRKGELPKRDLTELQTLKQQIDQARVEKQAAKDALIALRDAKLVEKPILQSQLDAAAGAAAKAPIRAQIDAVNAAIDQARADLAVADMVLDSLRTAREEALFEERLAKNTLLAEDAIKVTDRKAQQAKDAAERRAWLEKRG